MKPKSLLLLALALGCGLVASIGISQVMEGNAKGRGPSVETASIYVAMHNINLGDPIDATMVSLQEWPKDKVPPGALTSLENVEGRRPRTNIIAGEPILDAKLLAQGETVDPIASIPDGFRLTTIAVDAESSAAGLLSPGDRVDIQLFVNRNDRSGIAQARTKVILQNIKVFAIEQAVQRSADGGEARTIPKTVSLLVTPEQAAKIDLAQNLGQLSLIPRSPNDESMTAGVDVDASSLWEDASERNTRAEEQKRDEGAAQPKASLLSGLVSMMRKTADTRPPFEMELVLADEVTVKEFDGLTGKPLREKSKRVTPASKPASQQTPTPAGAEAAPESEFPIEFQEPFFE